MDKEFYIFGKPVKTDLCEIRFLKYFEYIENLNELTMISMNVLHIYYQYKKLSEISGFEPDDSLEDLKGLSLFNIVRHQDSFKDSYKKILDLVICEDDGVIGKSHIIEAILDNEDMFMEYRSRIMEMNMLTEEEVSPNPEIQEFIDAGRELKQQNSDKQTYSDIMSTIVVGTGIDYDAITNWTVLRVYATYYRISAFKNSEVTALFATVTDKVKYETFDKRIDLFENKKSGMKMSEFNKQYGGLFK